MTLGTSLFLITVLVLLILGAKFITKKKKWLLVGKITGAIVLLCISIGLAGWGWFMYKERPQPVSKLGSISLGMTPLEVTLAIGKPTHEILPNEIDTSRRYLYQNYIGAYEYIIKFSGIDETSSDVVDIVCSEDYSKNIFGLGNYDSEESVIKKLGSPSNESIRLDGLAKTISYEKWNVAFEIEQEDVSRICVTSSGKVSYTKEYGSEEI